MLNQDYKNQHMLLQEQKIIKINSKLYEGTNETNINPMDPNKYLYRCIQKRDIRPMKNFKFYPDT